MIAVYPQPINPFTKQKNTNINIKKIYNFLLPSAQKTLIDNLITNQLSYLAKQPS
jgi:hypothetical protein